MFASDPEVTELLGRVMSRTPATAEQQGFRRSNTEKEDDAPLNPDDSSWQLPGIFGRTRVTTNFGQVPAQLIRVGDCVRTRSGRYLPVQRIRETKLEPDFFRHHPEARPVLIRRDAIERGCPLRDVILSPAQVITLRVRGRPSRAVTARSQAQGFQSVDQTLGELAYYEFELEAPDDICCEGLWVNSAATPSG